MRNGYSVRTFFVLMSSLIMCFACEQMPLKSIGDISKINVVENRNLPDFTAKIKIVGMAVVNIRTIKTIDTSLIYSSIPEGYSGEIIYEYLKYYRPSGNDGNDFLSQSFGSGFIVDQNGYILTNSHVIEGAEHIVVKLADNREFDAVLVGIDRPSDIGLLKINATNLPEASIGDSNNIEIGEWVIAIGSPFGFYNSVTQGIVSAKGRELPRQNIAPLIQTDVAVNPGSSGGPLVNSNGEVIGINTEIYSMSGSSMGISFAVPIDIAMSVKEKLRSHGLVERSRLGVSIQTASWDLGEPLGLEKEGGAIISSLESGGPAQNAGLRIGDIILSFDDREVKTSAGLLRLVSDSIPGHKARLNVWRSNSYLNILVKLGELEAYSLSKEIKVNDITSRRSGIDLRELSLTERKRLYTEGIVVIEAVKGKTILSGLESGDVILAINNHPVVSVKQLRSELAKGGKRIALLVQKDANTKLFVSLFKQEVD